MRAKAREWLQDHEDRISQLPEPILHHIVSFLPTKFAIRTCVLSKTWNSAWNSFPVLDFSQHEYFNNKYKTYKESVQDFCNYVDNSIARRSPDLSVHKFNLRVYFNESRWEDLERWLNYAISNNVKHLAFHYFGEYSCIKDVWQYLLPTSTLFRAKPLQELDLCGCKLVESGIRSDIHIGFSLRKLHLSHVYIDDHTLQSLLSNSFSIEKLRIRYCKGFQSVSVCSTKLKSADLGLSKGQVQNIAIEGPNPQFFYLFRRFGNILSSSLEASKYNKNLKKLVLFDVKVTDAIFRVIQEFGVLQELKLNSCLLQISSYRLSKLAMSDTNGLKNGELVIACLNCYSKNNGIGSIPLSGLYKLEINLIS